MPKCRKCESTEDVKSGLCKPCAAEWQREYRRKNGDMLRAKERRKYREKRKDPEFVESERKRGREYWRNLRREALDAYGAVCACCGETEELFLTFDHANNDGAEHRKSLGYENNGKGASSATLKWMRDNDYPDSMQVLCMNCNMGKQRNGGVCPHTKYEVNSGEAQTG